MAHHLLDGADAPGILEAMLHVAVERADEAPRDGEEQPREQKNDGDSRRRVGGGLRFAQVDQGEELLHAPTLYCGARVSATVRRGKGISMLRSSNAFFRRFRNSRRTFHCSIGGTTLRRARSTTAESASFSTPISSRSSGSRACQMESARIARATSCNTASAWSGSSR